MQNFNVSTKTKSGLDLSSVRLTDVIDVEFLQRFQDDFAAGVGLASVTVDPQGNPVTKPSKYIRFCKDYTHSTECGDKRCAESHRKGGEEAARVGKPVVYECHAGLIDFAAPIMLEGRLIGTILGGQVLAAPPQVEKYRQIAKEIGVDPDEYVEASKETRVLSKEAIEAAANIMYTVANSMSLAAHRQNMVITSLHETALDLMANLDQDDVLKKILSRATELFGAPHGFVHLVDEEKGTSTLKIGTGAFSEFAYQGKLTDGLVGEAYRTGQIVVVDDYSVWDKRLPQNVFDEMHYFVLVPIKVGQKMIGAFGLAYSEARRTFADYELSLLQRFADLAFIALNNATLVASYENEIRKRRQVEEELRKSRNFLDRIINTIGDPIFIKDRQHRWVLLNDALCNFIGHNRGELLGKSDYDFFPKEEADVFGEKDEVVLTTGLENINEEKFSDAQGDLHTIETKKTLFIDEKGEKFIVGIIRDMTKQKQIEDQLKLSEEKFYKIFEMSPSVISISWENGTYADVNESFCKATGYIKEELISKTPSELGLWVNSKDRDFLLEGLKKYGEVNNVKAWFHCKDGRKICGLMSSRIININGEVCIMSVANDITKQEYIEEQLRSSKEKFAKVFHLSPDATTIGRLDGTFVEVNEGFTQMYGYSQGEAIGKTSVELGLWSDHRDRERMVERMKSHGEIRNMKVALLHKNGSIVHGLLSARALNIDGEPRFMFMVRDITELKQAEKEIFSYQEKLQALVGELSLTEERERRRLAVDLHDQVSQPLALAKIKLKMLIKAAEDQGCSCIDQNNEIIIMLNEAIQNSRSLTFDLCPPILYELGFAAAIQYLGDKLQEHHQIVFAFKDDGKPKPIDEETKIILFKAVRELLINVIKHTQASAVQVSISSEAGKIKIEVADNGKGFQVSTVTKGFGLFNISERINHIGGSFQVESTVGQGTRVILSGPLSDSEPGGA